MSGRSRRCRLTFRTRLKSGSSKVLKDDKSANSSNEGEKMKLPWSGIAAGVGGVAGVAGVAGVGGGVGVGLKKKSGNGTTNSNTNSNTLNTTTTSTTTSSSSSTGNGNGNTFGESNGGGVFAISAAAGGSGLFGSKKGLYGDENEKSEGTASSIPYRVGSSRLRSIDHDHDHDHNRVPSRAVKLRSNAGGKKYSSKQMLAIWDNMKNSVEVKEAKRIGISELEGDKDRERVDRERVDRERGDRDRGDRDRGDRGDKHHHNHTHNHHYHNTSFTSKLFPSFGRYNKSPNDLYYSNSITGPVKYEPPPKEYDNKRYEERSDMGGAGGGNTHTANTPAVATNTSITNFNTTTTNTTSTNLSSTNLSSTNLSTSSPNTTTSSTSTSTAPVPLPTDSWSPFASFSIAPNPTNAPVITNRNSSSSNLIDLASKATTTQSDFFNSPINRVATPLSNPTVTPPPGIPAATASPNHQQFILPENIQWFYKDPSGVERGPFSGKVMHDWYTGNWLKEDLLIKRAGEHDYIRLYDFKLKVGNFSEPFRVSLPPVPIPVLQSQQQPPPQQFPPFSANQPFPQPGPLFDDLQRDVFRHQQFAPPPPIPNAWGSAASPSPVVAPPGPISPISPWTQHLQPQQSNFFQDPSILSATAPIIAPPPVSIPEPTSSPIGQSLWKVDEIVEGEGVKDLSIEQVKEPERVEPEPAPEPILSKSELRKAKKKAKAELSIQQAQVEAEGEVEGGVEVEVETQVQPPPSQVQPSQPPPSQQPLNSIQPLPSPTPSPSNTSPPSLTPTPAPWANKDTKPTLSLKEIQELESAKRAKQTAIQKELHHQQVLAARISNPSTSSASTILPTTAKWGTTITSSTTGAQKTLAEIQKEEELAAIAKKRAASVSSQNQPQTSPAIILPSGKKYAEIALPGASKPSPAPAPLPATTAWTTVGPGGRKVSSPINSSSPISNASPLKHVTSSSILRPAPKTQPQTNTTPTASDEFLQWCKTSLQGLNPSVSQNELLSMLLSLPATLDSKEIIAETIYSNSSTMDGRKFAEDFLKKRNVADKEKSGETWSDILQRNSTLPPKVDNDGWNPAFKVVKKKNKRVD